MANKKLYVGCALTGASEEFKQNVEATKELLENDWDVMQFLGLGSGTAEDVYRVAILENVDGCDAFLGIVDERSFGLGWEACRAVERKKPALLVAQIGSHITRLALGAPSFEDIEVRGYAVMQRDIPRIAQEVLAPKLT